MPGDAIPGNARFRRSMSTATKEAEAMRLRALRLPWQEIADRVGYTTRGAAKRAADRGLAAVQYEGADALRTYELASLDELECKAWEVLRALHYTVDHGKVVMHPETGEPLIDDAPVLQAIDRILRIKERRAKLTGIDAPTRIELTESAIDAEIARLTTELGSIPETRQALPAADPPRGS